MIGEKLPISELLSAIADIDWQVCTGTTLARTVGALLRQSGAPVVCLAIACRPKGANGLFSLDSWRLGCADDEQGGWAPPVALADLIAGHAAIRYDLESASYPWHDDSLDRLRSQGVTEVLFVPIASSCLGDAAIMLATDRIGGWTVSEVENFAILVKYLSPVIESAMSEPTSLRNIAET